MSEKCQRCGEVGQNMRTLHLSCLYDLMELGIPFDIVYLQSVGIAVKHRIYTLRVCKGCRAEWLQSVKQWFNTPRADNLDSNGIVTIPVSGYGVEDDIT